MRNVFSRDAGSGKRPDTASGEAEIAEDLGGRNTVLKNANRNIRCAHYLEELVQSSRDFEMLAPVELSIFCFRYRPAGFEGDLEAVNEWILTNLQRAGKSYLSNARVDGRFALRGCVLNYRTSERDMERLLDDIRTAAP